MKIQSKKGLELDVLVTGDQKDVKIQVLQFVAGGQQHPGTQQAKMQHWTQKDLDRGLVIPATGAFPQIYIECTEIEQLDKAIAQLPERKEYIYKEERKIDADGDIIWVKVWRHSGCSSFIVSGHTITQAQMESFLERMGIEKIERKAAIQLFTDENNINELRQKREESRRAMQAAYDDDLAEEGIAQANENWGYDSKFIR